MIKGFLIKGMNKQTQTLRYYFLSFLSFLIFFIGVVGMRLVTIAIGIGLALLLEKHLGKLGITVGWITSLILFGIVLFGLERIYPFLEKLDDYAKANKRYPFTEKYGSNYTQPKPEDFGISKDEFQEYNSRFQFEYLKMLFTYGLWIAACIYSLQAKLTSHQKIFLIGGAVATATFTFNMDFLPCNCLEDYNWLQ